MTDKEKELFLKKVNKVFDMLSGKDGEHAMVRFSDFEQFDHKLEFLYFPVQNNYWIGHVSFNKKDHIEVVEHWTFDGETRKMVYYFSGLNSKRHSMDFFENCEFDTGDVFKKIDLLMIKLV